MEKKTIGNFISVLRRASGMTQKQLGEMLYVSDKTVSRWERDECEPELALIPAIAEIFGITTDELLRGEKNAQTTSGGLDDSAAESRRRARSDKQFRAMLRNRQTHYQNMSRVSVGLIVVGVLFAMAFNLGMSRGVFAFCAATACLVGALICQLCFVSNALMPLEDEGERELELRRFNSSVTRRKMTIFWWLAVVFAFVLPLSMLGYAGLGWEAWLILGGASAGVIGGGAYLFYIFVLRERMIREGSLYVEEEEKAHMAQEKKLLRKMSVIGLGLAAVLIVSVMVVETLDPQLFAKPKECRTLEEFEEYTYLIACEEFYGYFSQEEIDKWMTAEEKKALEVWKTPFKDEAGNVLCEYWRGPQIVEIRTSFDTSADGTPIYVYRELDYQVGHYTIGQIQTSLWAMTALELAVCAIVYTISRRRIYKTNQ